MFERWERLEGHAARLAQQTDTTPQEQADAESAADVAFAAWELSHGETQPAPVMHNWTADDYDALNY